jgi:hypothetical protein
MFIMKKTLLKGINNERGGVDVLIVTLFVMPCLLFLSFLCVPFYVFQMKGEHLDNIVNHAAIEAQNAGYLTPTIIASTNSRLALLGMGAINISGTNYPTYTGSTTSKVLADDANPTITVTVKYPAPNLSKFTLAIGGSGNRSVNEGYYLISLQVKSQAYN